VSGLDRFRRRRGQVVTDSVVYGSVIQISDVIGPVDVTVHPQHPLGPGATLPAEARVRLGAPPLEPPAFQPRSEMGELLWRRLAGQDTAVAVCTLVGGRGTGKSHLAAACARRADAEGWPMVGWADASDATSLLAFFSAWAERLGIVLPGEPEAAAHAALDWLRATEQRCLLVFDNATDPDVVRQWIPATGTVSVLITTNQTNFAVLSPTRPIEVGLFTVDEAVTYLGERTGRGAAGAVELAEDLGRLPLALAQAAATMVHDGNSYERYRARLHAVPVGELLGRVRGDGYPYGLAQAVMLSVSRVEEGTGQAGAREHDAAPVARCLLDVIALLPGDAVPRNLLHASVRASGLPADEDTVDGVLGDLAEISLVTRVGTAAVAMHNLTQTVLLDRARNQGTVLGTMADVLSAFEATEPSKDDAWEHREEIRQRTRQLAHLRDLCSAPTANSAEDSDAWAGGLGPRSSAGSHVGRRLLDALSRCLMLLNEASESSTALEHGPGVVAGLQNLLGPDDPAVMTCKYHLAGAYLGTWRSSEAGELLTALRENQARILGRDHPDTLATQAQLAAVLTQAGSTREAITLLTQVWEARSRVLGEAHRDTLSTRNELAGAYAAGGDFGTAIQMCEQVYADCRAMRGPDDPDVLNSRTALVNAYWMVGDLERAIDMARAVVADRRRVQGGEHARTLSAQMTLAGLYQAEGHWRQAIATMEEVVETCRHVQGEAHIDTLMNMLFLGNALDAAGRTADAVAITERILAVAEDAQGQSSPVAQICRRNLAARRLTLGRIEEALALHATVVDEQRRDLGADHLTTLVSRSEFADALMQVARSDAAIDMYEAIVADRTRVQGPDHSDTLTSRSQLAGAYLQTRRTEEAVTVYEEVVASRRRSQGEDHEDTLASRAALANAHAHTWQPAVAVTMLEDLLADRRRLKGDNHHRTLATWAQLGHAYITVSRLSDAVLVFEQVATARDQVLGAEHPLTLTSRADLADAYRRAGRFQLVIPILTAVATGRLRTLGEGHPDTLSARRELADAHIDAGDMEQGLAMHAEWLGAARGILTDPTLSWLVTFSFGAALLRVGRTDQGVEMLQRLLASGERALGQRHHVILTVRDQIADAYVRAGLTGEGVALLEQTLERLVAEHGEAHQQVTGGRLRLAGAYDGAGRSGEAIAIYEAALTTIDEALPDGDSKLTARLMIHQRLANAYAQADQVDKALATAASLVTESRRLLGDGHELTLGRRADHAQILGNCGQVDEAISAYEALLSDLSPDHRASHTAVGSIRTALAALYFVAGREAEGIAVMNEVSTTLGDVLGKQHPQTLSSLGNLAWAYKETGSPERAIDTMEAVVAAQRSALGADHQRTLHSRQQLVGFYQAAGRHTEALSLYEALVADQRQARGESDPRTLELRGELANAYRLAGLPGKAVVELEGLLADDAGFLARDDELFTTHRLMLVAAYAFCHRFEESLALGEAALTQSDAEAGEDSSLSQSLRNMLADIRAFRSKVQAPSQAEEAEADGAGQGEDPAGLMHYVALSDIERRRRGETVVALCGYALSGPAKDPKEQAVCARCRSIHQALPGS
jgi:tetratricopeptide (TPR) repeat protein